jgi:hypothetical protein
MSIFSQLLVEALSGAANAGLKTYQQQHAPAPAPHKKRRNCSSCDALREVERAKARVAKGKL